MCIDNSVLTLSEIKWTTNSNACFYQTVLSFLTHVIDHCTCTITHTDCIYFMISVLVLNNLNSSIEIFLKVYFGIDNWSWSCPSIQIYQHFIILPHDWTNHILNIRFWFISSYSWNQYNQFITVIVLNVSLFLFFQFWNHYEIAISIFINL